MDEFHRARGLRTNEDEAVALARPAWPSRAQFFEHGGQFTLGKGGGFGNVPPVVRRRCADPDAVGVAWLTPASQDANQMGIVRRPVEDDGLGGMLEHLARLLRFQVELKDGVCLCGQEQATLKQRAGLLDKEDAFAVGVPAHGEIGGDVTGVIAASVEDGDRFRRLAVPVFFAQPAGVDGRRRGVQFAGGIAGLAAQIQSVLGLGVSFLRGGEDEAFVGRAP